MMKKKSLLRRILTACGILAFLAAVAYGIYYFFFAEDEEELDDDFFDEAEENAAEGEPASDADTASQPAEKPASDVEFAVP